MNSTAGKTGEGKGGVVKEAVVAGHPLGLLLSLIIEFRNGLGRELVDNFISD